tara:strand:- start:45 stop:230 length:186 start_codon:yes stop_codon:yes gene_type:complete
MPYHIKRPRPFMSGDVYYKGDAQWTDVYADRKQYSSNPTSTVMNNADGKNGGFANATAVSE